MLNVEHLEDRECPSIANPVVDVLYVGTPAQTPDQTAFLQVLTHDYTQLLAPWGVGVGSVGTQVRIPDPGPLTNAQVQQLLFQEITLGALPHPTPNTIDLVFLPDNVTDPILQLAAGWHNTFTAPGNITTPYAVTYTNQPADEYVTIAHEFAESSVDPYLNGVEIADPFNGQAFMLNGFPVSEFALPGGMEYQPPLPPYNALQLALLPAQEFRALFFQTVALWYDPAFTQAAQAAQYQLDTNPMTPTPWGRDLIQAGEAAFYGDLFS